MKRFLVVVTIVAGLASAPAVTAAKPRGHTRAHHHPSLHTTVHRRHITLYGEPWQPEHPGARSVMGGSATASGSGFA